MRRREPLRFNQATSGIGGVITTCVAVSALTAQAQDSRTATSPTAPPSSTVVAPAPSAASSPKYDIPAMSPQAQARLNEIQAKLEAKWQTIRTLEVKFTFELREEVSGTIGRFKEHVLLDGSKRLVDGFHGSVTGPYAGRMHHTVASFLDNKTHSLSHSAAQVSVQTGPQMVVSLDGSGFFQLNGLKCPKQPVEGQDARPFCDPYWARRDGMACMLREQRDVLDGIECDVMEWRSVHSPLPDMIVWLDPARNYLPIRTIYRPQPNGSALMEFRILEAVEAAPGLWFGIKATKHVDPSTLRSKSGDELMDRKPHTYDMVVTTDEHGTPFLYVNHEIAAERFKLQIPADYSSYDIDAQRRGEDPRIAPPGKK